MLPKGPKNSVEFIRRNENALVVVDNTSLTSVSTSGGKTLSVFTALEGFEPESEARVTTVSIQPSVLIEESVIYFGFSNGVWCSFGFSGSKICLGPLDNWKFNSPITYIARINSKG